MTARIGALALLLSSAGLALAQGSTMTAPKQVVAGQAFTIETSGSGLAVLYINGPGQSLRQPVQLGQPVSIPAGSLHNAGSYLVLLAASGTVDKATLDVTPETQVAQVSFLAKPSRLPVGLHGGITGAVYLFDSYQNLITRPQPVTFQLRGGSGGGPARTVTTRYGSAWTQMDSAAKEGTVQFLAQAGGVTSTRVIQEVPGDPCGLHVSARPAPGDKIELQTDPLRDCTGNPVPDGTIVTFTEAYGPRQTTVDVPLKRGIAQTVLPAVPGAKISAAAGVVLGNEIRWGGR